MTFPSNVKLLSTPRLIEGGSSQGNFRNFNLALHVKDEQSSVMANRELLSKHYNYHLILNGLTKLIQISVLMLALYVH